VNPVEQLAIAWQCLRHAVAQLARPAFWAPWLLLGAIEVGAVVALAGFAHPALSWFTAPILVRLGGEPALHYPAIFRMLPALFARADLVIATLIGSLVTGVATALFAVRYVGGEGPPGDLWWRALRRSPTLVMVSLPLTLLTLALSAGLSTVTADGSGLVNLAAGVVAFGAALLLQAWFVFAVPYVVLDGRGWIAALSGLPRAAARGMVGALFLTLLAALPSLPFQQLARAADVIVDRGRPELMVGVLCAQIAAGLIGAFVLTGSVTLFFQSAVARPRFEEEDEA
jgi:hypothetical protein